MAVSVKEVFAFCHRLPNVLCHVSFKVGGMVAQVASIDLGWAGLSHWSHNHGSPRVFNLATAQLFEKLYEG